MLLQRGDHGDAVERVQRALRALGFDIDVDGDFGTETEQAVEQFQSTNDLDVDGEVGPETLRALGLDLDVPDEDVGAADDETPEDPGDDEITFTVEETTVPDVVQQRIDELVDTVARRLDGLLTSAAAALESFETTMKFGSNDTFDASGALLSDVVSVLAASLADLIPVPGIATAVALGDAVIKTVAGGLEDAGKATEGSLAGRWIMDQRAAIDQARRELTSATLETQRADLGSWYLEHASRADAFDELVEATTRLRDGAEYTDSDFLALMFERWIDDHFTTLGAEKGCIEYRFEYDDREFSFVSCTVAAPFGSQIEDGLNRLLEQRLVPWLSRPFDLRVRKHACFLVDNVNPGGRSWNCGWLDRDDSVLHEPIDEDAIEAMADEAWKRHGRFAR